MVGVHGCAQIGEVGEGVGAIADLADDPIVKISISFLVGEVGGVDKAEDQDWDDRRDGNSSALGGTGEAEQSADDCNAPGLALSAVSGEPRDYGLQHVQMRSDRRALGRGER